MGNPQTITTCGASPTPPTRHSLLGGVGFPSSMRKLQLQVLGDIEPSKQSDLHNMRASIIFPKSFATSSEWAFSNHNDTDFSLRLMAGPVILGLQIYMRVEQCNHLLNSTEPTIRDQETLAGPPPTPQSECTETIDPHWDTASIDDTDHRIIRTTEWETLLG